MWRPRLVPIVVLAIACKGQSERRLEPAAFGKTVAPPGELGKLRLGMPIAEARKAAPGLVPAERTYGTFPSGIAGVRLGVGVSDDRTRISRIKLILPPGGKDVLVQAWGPGQDLTCLREPCTYWFDPATGTRARLEPDSRVGSYVDFSSYTRAQALFGAKPVALAFETAPILGATLEELQKAYAATLHREDPSAYLELPPTEYELDATRIQLAFEHGRVHRISFGVPSAGHAPARDAILAAIDAAWGTGQKAMHPGGEQVVWFDAEHGRRANLEPGSDDDVDLTIMRYLPLLALLGADGERLGFEKTPLLGATWKEITQAYPDQIEVKPGVEPQFALPPTEWGSYVTLVYLDYDAQQRVSSYRVDIPYGSHPAARDEIWAALQKRFGGPGRPFDDNGRAKIELRATPPRVVVTDDDVGKGWSIEVGRPPPPPPPRGTRK